MSALSDYIMSIAPALAYFPMGESTGSLTSTGGDAATVSGAVTRAVAPLVPGTADGALRWDAISARAVTSTADKWRLGSSGFTVATVIKYTSTGFGTILSVRNSSSVVCAVTVGRILSGDISAETWSWSDSNTRVRSGRAHNDGVKRVVIARYRSNDNTLDLWIDGVLVDARAQGTGRPTSGSDYRLVIGNNIAGADQGVVGLTQDETILWSSALTDDQLSRISRALTDGVVPIAGNVTTVAGVAADKVIVFRWSDGALVQSVAPGATGSWTASVPPATDLGITYLASGCQPVTHGPYQVAA